VAAYGQLMGEQARRLRAQWRHGDCRDISEDMMGLTLAIVVRSGAISRPGQLLMGAAMRNERE